MNDSRNIKHLIVCSTSKILKKLQYYGDAIVKNINLISIIDDIFDKSIDESLDVSTYKKELVNIQNNLIRNDENICWLRPKTDQDRYYKTFGSGSSNKNGHGDLRIILESTSRLVNTQYSFGTLRQRYAKIILRDFQGLESVFQCSDYGVCNIKNLPAGNYYIRYCLIDTIKPFMEPTSGLPIVTIKKDVTNVYTMTLPELDVNDSTVMTGTLRLYVINNQEMNVNNYYESVMPASQKNKELVSYSKIWVTKADGTIEKYTTDNDGYIEITGLPAGETYFYVETLPGYIKMTTRQHVYVAQNTTTNYVIETQLKRPININ